MTWLRVGYPSPATVVWAVAMLVILAMLLLSLRHRAVRVPAKRVDRLVRSPNHQAQVIALVDWLQQPKIVRTILEQRVATAQGLQDTLEGIEGLKEEDVAATVGLLLQNKQVRVVVASYTQRARGLPAAAVRAALVDWALPVREELVH